LFSLTSVDVHTIAVFGVDAPESNSRV